MLFYRQMVRVTSAPVHQTGRLVLLRPVLGDQAPAAHITQQHFLIPNRTQTEPNRTEPTKPKKRQKENVIIESKISALPSNQPKLIDLK